MKVMVAVFLALHGIVHLLYAGQSWRLFELEAGLSWPEGSWALSGVFGDGATRLLASGGCVLAAIGFVAGAAAVLFSQPGWRPLVVVSAGLSSAVFLLFWDGETRNLDGQGGIGLLINLAILITVLLVRWPDLGD